MCFAWGEERGGGSEKSLAKEHSQESPREGLFGSGFLTGGGGQFWLVHRLFFNNLEK
jgi:hypothetical protein